MVDVSILRTAEEAKRRLPLRYPAELSRQLPQVPSGNRRPHRTGVCASPRTRDLYPEGQSLAAEHGSREGKGGGVPKMFWNRPKGRGVYGGVDLHFERRCIIFDCVQGWEKERKIGRSARSLSGVKSTRGIGKTPPRRRHGPQEPTQAPSRLQHFNPHGISSDGRISHPPSLPPD